MLLVLAALGVVGEIKTPYSRNDYKAFLGFVRLHYSYVVSLYDIDTFFGNTVRIVQHDFYTSIYRVVQMGCRYNIR